MTVENISWSNLHEKYCRPSKCQTGNLPIASRTPIQLSYRGKHCSLVTSSVFDRIKWCHSKKQNGILQCWKCHTKIVWRFSDSYQEFLTVTRNVWRNSGNIFIKIFFLTFCFIRQVVKNEILLSCQLEVILDLWQTNLIKVVSQKNLEKGFIKNEYIFYKSTISQHYYWMNWGFMAESTHYGHMELFSLPNYNFTGQA